MSSSASRSLKSSAKSLARSILGCLGSANYSGTKNKGRAEQEQLWIEIAEASTVTASGGVGSKVLELKDSRPLTQQIPQANVLENGYSAYEEKDWRSHFASKLSGRGLEIGPLHRPMVQHDGMQVEYIDRSTVAELREHYPELRDLPLVDPDIIGDAQSMDNVQDDQYNFVIAAHVIEHMRNPIKALKEWVRVTQSGGHIYMIVPDKRAIFDRPRVRTTLEHLILDFHRPSLVRDYEHFLDYAVHVHGKKGEAALKNADELAESDYSIHFHVFLPTDIMRMCRWFSEHVYPIRVLEGPVGSPRSDEFHLLIQKV
jgi:SAM-dependent methyltransferase